MSKGQTTRSTDVGVQGQGFRLQKLRAVKLLLESLERDPSAAVAVEYGADVRLESRGQTYNEEDKLYESQGSFTLASTEVSNTLVNFLDLYTSDTAPRESYRFGFYTNLPVGKEKQTGRTKKLGIKIPKGGLLHAIVSGGRDLAGALSLVVPFVRDVVCETLCKPSKHASPCVAVSCWEKSDWFRFLDKIQWSMGKPGNEGISKELIKAIRDSSFYEATLDGKEPLIRSALIDALDETQGKENRTERMLTKDKVENIYLRALRGTPFQVDRGAAHAWRERPEPQDTRGLLDKIRARLDSTSARFQRYLDREELKAACAQQRRQTVGNREEYDASLCVVYDATSRCLDQSSTRFACASDFEQFFDQCATRASVDLKQRQQTFSYHYSDVSTLRDMALFLFDSCYFDFSE